jgi:hypothetical protein
MRLTNPETKLKLSDTKRYDLQDHKMFEKLKELEDIEEELGIDLVTLFKALKNGFYYKKQGIVHTSDRENYIFLSAKSCLPNQMCIEVHFGDLETMWFYFDDYGKTWALTRKELEKPKEN